jgi:hypothetical protein
MGSYFKKNIGELKAKTTQRRKFKIMAKPFFSSPLFKANDEAK